ncbi:GNAT family N-acetyltransferase [Sneathiella aquimaris]|uniref:GNAT family N-acetyltransferase n=1 Tax=Sneathiella aquimaris TaxID=2599305 RepID=UPI00146B2291|nr:GNAT family N-acetyltransferase [Sneathiella aquimaris]
MTQITYRFAKDSDAEGLIALVAQCYAEYEGCILDVDGEEPQYRSIASFFADNGGLFWVAEQGGKIVGSVGFAPKKETAELKHLYVDSNVRRQGLASSLCQLVEDAVQERGLPTLYLWTDTRFENAHRLYEKRGFIGGAVTRTLSDLSQSVEYYYEKALRPS